MEIDARLRDKVAAYKPSAKKLADIANVPMLFAVGIVGAGKNALLETLLKKYPNDYLFLVSHTSRAPRVNEGVMERDGEQYHFVGLEGMERMLDSQDLIEAAVIHDTQISGSSIEEVQKAKQQNKIVVSDIDIQGIEHYKKIGLLVKPVFILPPSYDVWKARLTARYGDHMDERDLRYRIQSAIKEIEHALNVDYFYIVINEDLDETADLLNEIAHGETVDPHYHKAMKIAEHLLENMHEALARLAE